MVHGRVWEGDIQAGTNAKVLRLESRFHVWGAAGGSVGKEGKRTELRDEQKVTLASSDKAL